MIKDNQKLLNRLHVVMDALVIMFSYVSSWYLRFKSGIFSLDPWFLSLQEYAKVLIIIVPGYLILYYGFQLYTPKRVQGRRLEAWAYHSGKCNWINGFYTDAVFNKTIRFLKRNDICIFPCKCISGDYHT